METKNITRDERDKQFSKALNELEEAVINVATTGGYLLAEDFKPSQVRWIRNKITSQASKLYHTADELVDRLAMHPIELKLAMEGRQLDK